MVIAPAIKPVGSRMISAGIRRRLARTCEPTARARIRPTPSRTWLVVTDRSSSGRTSSSFARRESVGAEAVRISGEA